MTKPRIAIYPGSFDPLTNGHLDIIRRGAGLFDEIIVAVGDNPSKRNYWFDLEARCGLVRSATHGLSNVRVVSFQGLMVEAARTLGATAILRGVRALADFDAEFRNGLANRDLSGMETLFLLADPAHIFVSSSLVKEIASNGGDVTAYVPPEAAKAITARCSEGG
jgi:pantetheine-phosphate adenylyltransferase